MSRSWRVGLQGVPGACALLLVSSAAWAAGFAADGTKGTLNIEVKVEGSGNVPSQQGVAWRSYDWQVRNQANLQVQLVALTPAVDPASLEGVAAVYEQADEGDDDWEEAWDEKLQACDGDETCEMRVEMQKMGDPRMQALMAGVMTELMEIDPEDAAPSLQHWAFLGGTVTGSASVEETIDTFDVMSSEGGSLEDTHCRTAGQQTFTARPTGSGDLHVALTVNARDSSYEIRLPIDQAIQANDDCHDGRQQQMPLLPFSPVGATYWTEALTARGTLSGTTGQPALSGSKVWEGEWRDGTGQKTRVTIAWSFAP